MPYIVTKVETYRPERPIRFYYVNQGALCSSWSDQKSAAARMTRPAALKVAKRSAAKVEFVAS